MALSATAHRNENGGGSLCGLPWGLLVGGLVLALDERILWAVLWVLAGIFNAVVGLRLLKPFSSPLMEWYRGLNATADLLERLLWSARRGVAETDELKRLMMKRRFGSV